MRGGEGGAEGSRHRNVLWPSATTAWGGSPRGTAFIVPDGIVRGAYPSGSVLNKMTCMMLRLNFDCGTKWIHIPCYHGLLAHSVLSAERNTCQHAMLCCADYAMWSWYRLLYWYIVCLRFEAVCFQVPSDLHSLQWRNLTMPIIAWNLWHAPNVSCQFLRGKLHISSTMSLRITRLYAINAIRSEDSCATSLEHGQSKNLIFCRQANNLPSGDQ